MEESVANDLGIEGLQDPVEIGVGGFATVYKAYQPAFRRTVAVKVLAALNLDEAAKERFERECQAMGALSEHPNIVTVYGAGFTNSGRPYLVMAFLPGGSLAERIEKSRNVSWQEATLIGVHLAGALETAHRAEIIHRDIKPANVLMSAYGDAQLSDFGIARISGGHETRSGVITASMAHAPPEVLDGQRPSMNADVYSLGSTIFELIYGSPAFQAEGDESMVPMLRRILTEPPPDLRAIGVPDSICRAIERSMAKEPGERQQSAVEFGRELMAARRAEGLDPGKLTVPAEVNIDFDDAASISFVAAPTAPVGSAGAVTQGVVPGSAVTAQVQAPVGGVAPGYEAGPAYVPEGEKKKSKKGVLIGIAIFVALLVAAGTIAAVVLSGHTDVAGPGTSQASTTPTAKKTYTAEVERAFVDRCAENGEVSRSVCRCIIDSFKDNVPYDKFLDLNERARKRENLSGTELGKFKEECVAKATSTTAPTINGIKGPGETG